MSKVHEQHHNCGVFNHVGLQRTDLKMWTTPRTENISFNLILQAQILPEAKEAKERRVRGFKSNAVSESSLLC